MHILIVISKNSSSIKMLSIYLNLEIQLLAFSNDKLNSKTILVTNIFFWSDWDTRKILLQEKELEWLFNL